MSVTISVKSMSNDGDNYHQMIVIIKTPISVMLPLFLYSDNMKNIEFFVLVDE